jgi:energy-coupling factor transporter ATP-binding protein EcfA2
MKIAIQSLRAVECGPLRDVKIDFASEGAHPTTVLAGANGSGKTTVLEIITALFELISDGSLVSARPVVYPLDFESTPNSLNPAGRILRRVGFAEMEVHIDGKLLKVGFSSAEPTMEAGRASLIYYPMDGRIDQLGHHTMMHSTFIVQLGYKIRDAEQRTLPFTFSNKDGFPNVDQFLPSVLFFPAYRVIKPNQGEQITREETKYEWVYRYENATDFRSSIDSFLLWLEYSAPEEYQRAIRFLDSLDLGGKDSACYARS